MHASGLDLNRLAVFQLLMRERSVTAAAQQLGLGQPAVSRTLALLREMFDDPLFVRSGRVLEPTPRARTLYEELAPAFEQIERALRASRPFEPQETSQIFKIAMSDDVQLSALPGIGAALNGQMPMAKLVAQTTDYRRAGRMLDDGAASVVVGYLDKLPANAKIKKLARVGYKMVAAVDVLLPVTLEDYCQRSHALVTFAADLIGYVDETLAEKGAQRDIAMSVSAFAMLPFILKARNLVATVPDHAALAIAALPGLHVAELPFDSPRFDLSMAWRAAVDKDPAEQMLRDIVESSVKSALE